MPPMNDIVIEEELRDNDVDGNVTATAKRTPTRLPTPLVRSATVGALVPPSSLTKSHKMKTKKAPKQKGDPQQKTRHKKTLHDANWDIGLVNKSWEIPADVKGALPALARSSLRRASRPNTVPLSAEERFLHATKLVVPTQKVTGLPHELLPDVPIYLEDIKDDIRTKLTPDDRRKYFGDAGKHDMRLVAAKLGRQMYMHHGNLPDFIAANPVIEQLEASDEIHGLFSGQLSARHKFIALSLAQKLPLSVRLLIRNTVSPHLNVSHMGMGDEMAKVFAQCVLELPMVTSLNIRNNRLTDPGLDAIVSVVTHKRDLVCLDISENKVDGDAAAALAEDVGSKQCALQELCMATCDIDDGEVQGFANALHTNTSLMTLVLSRNLIGKSEMLNVVQPDLITGGEAIASMLCNNNRLTKLDLSWNMLRLNSAVEIGKALAVNNGLRELNLAYNAFGNLGTQSVGMALRKNNCLQVLDLSHNNIPCEAAFVIAQALKVNDTVTNIVLDGNPLGKIGGQSLLHAVASTANHSLSISMASCNFDLFDPNTFNPDEATGNYDLDMNIPYERSIMLELLRCAETKTGCKFISIVHVVDKTSRPLQIEVRDVVTATGEALRHRNSVARRGTLLRRTMSKESLIQLFHELDKDNSGNIDAKELEDGMAKMGIPTEPGEAARLISRFDIDGSGTVEINEFIELMAVFDVAPRPKKQIVDALTNQPFEVPSAGRLVVDFLDLHIPTESTEAHTRESIAHLIRNLKGNNAHVQMLSIAKNGLYFREREAQLIIDSVLDGSDLVEAMASILPHMIDASNACQLIECNLADTTQRLRLQYSLRFAYGPIVGLCSGHYRLEMAEPLDRIAAKKLMEISNKTMLWKKKYELLDTSQHANYQCFRNETFNGKSVILENAFCDKIPKFGVLEFDFVHMASRPVAQQSKFQSIEAMSAKRFAQFLERMHAVGLDLEPHTELPRAYGTLTPNVFEHLLKMQRNAQYNDYSSGLAAFAEVELHGVKMTISVRRLIMELQYLLSSRWISVKQCLRVLCMWPRAFKAARVDVILLLIDRIVDLYSVPQLFALLTERELAELIFRYGWLNLWSPLVPDIYYELDMAIYEQREVAKMLVALALAEPGDNWLNETYGWSRGDPIPGWQLNQSWLGENAFPEKGYLTLHYYSGADLGCGPVWHVRVNLCKRVLSMAPEGAKLQEFIHHSTQLELRTVRDFTARPAATNPPTAAKRK
ncbi:hypothetical protein SDRG_07859 [Saprolegnia diclina VS20]|uniref:EF-hand domain-containing protein n=1 Tax=Saprolegnia diclina (strain VS20) TaxID=1156394 RepID=T0QIJ2_SAPDV|nr:hypothetical protein SDRG_07859 [Saprolegnia diclina VS20]EQC34531.1 hypothetical protein SDRG_07859 [Saprolegnia diclina VS20]|eukprot:XP_008611937.1 hypothetical protein SDRG_07859 [Saprolegnia diclina VS20]